MARMRASQFARIEWFGQIIVGAQFEADDAVDILAAGGQHQYRRASSLAQPPQDFETVHARQHHVEDHQVVAALQRPQTAPPSFTHSTV